MSPRTTRRSLGLAFLGLAFFWEVYAVVGLWVDATTVARQWIERHGVLRAKRAAYKQGPAEVWIVTEADVDRFIRDHPEWIDRDKMPDSPYRDAVESWVGLPEVHRRTGRNSHVVATMIRAGQIEGRRRGAHWYVPESVVPSIRPLRPDAIAESVFRRESVLEMRRYRRKRAA